MCHTRRRERGDGSRARNNSDCDRRVLTRRRHCRRREPLAAQRLATSTGVAPSHRIDTTSVLHGRSGNSSYRPKSSVKPVHHTPDAAVFVCRHFLGVWSQEQSSAADLLFTCVHGTQYAQASIEPTRVAASWTSILERAALVGKHHPPHSPVEISLALEIA